MRRPAAQVGDNDTFQDWFNGIPIVTKTLTLTTFMAGALATFGWISPVAMVLHFPSIKNNFEIWRLFTPFIFAGTFSFQFLIHMFVLYENCRRYETNPFNTGAGGNSADFIYMILVSMAILIVVGYYFDLMVLSEALLYVVVYVWSRRDPEILVNIFGVKFKSLYLPWAYVALKIVMGSSAANALVGIAVGHVYYFLVDVLPRSHGVNVIVTPKFCIDIASYCNSLGSAQPVGIPPRAAQAPVNRGNGGYQWGRGRTLGT